MLNSNLETTARTIQDKYWKEAHQAIRWTLFNILDELNAITVGGPPSHQAGNHLSSLFSKYQVVTFDEYPQWNQAGWLLLSEQEHPGLQEFARLSSDQFPIKEINLVLKQEYLCCEEIKNYFRFNLPNVSDNSSLYMEQQIWDQYLYSNNGVENLHNALKGLMYLNNLVTEYKIKKGILS